ncbi:MAG: GNAT family N-acetyltransferase [Ilumatobacter sp.]
MPVTVAPVIDATHFVHTPQPSLRAAELTLRPFERADAPTVAAAFSDPDIQQWHGFRVDELDQARAWIDRTHTRWSAAQSADWAITDGSVVLGRCALHLDCRGGTAEIAYWLLPEARGRGVVTRAVLSVTDWAHTELRVHRISLQHSTRNHASCAVAMRAGYVAEGTARQQGLHADGWHDMHQHSHLATD